MCLMIVDTFCCGVLDYQRDESIVCRFGGRLVSSVFHLHYKYGTKILYNGYLYNTSRSVSPHIPV